MSDEINFLTVLQSSLKISKKNQSLRQRAITIKKSKAILNTNEVILTTPSIVNYQTERLSKSRFSLYSEEKEEKFPIIDFYLLKGSDIKNFISDKVFNDLDLKLIETDIETWTDLDLLEAGKLMCYRKNYSMALEFLKKARVLNPNYLPHKLWKLLVSVIISQSMREKVDQGSGCCCASRNEVGPKQLLMKYVKILHKLQNSLEALWILLMISLGNTLKESVDIEPSRFYATKIKDLDEFYGFIAWSMIYIEEKEENASLLLIELMTRYSRRPEPYYLGWVYFRDVKDYEKCLEIASEAFLKITYDDFEGFYIIFCLKLAKSYYMTGKFTNSIELLYKKYLEHPEYPVFLFYLGKFCVITEDFAFTGIAKGTLRELLRVSEYSRRGKAFYYLIKAYLFTRQLPEVYKYAVKAMKTVDHSKKIKFKEIREIYMGLQGLMHNVSEIQLNIKSNKRISESLNKCQIIAEMHKPSSDLLTAELYYLQGDKARAVNTLRAMISSSRLEIAAYFKLLEFDPANADNIYMSLLGRVQSNQMPIQSWVKVNLSYAKFLFERRLYNKCFLTLRVFARFMPPLPGINLPYCNQLKAQKDLKGFHGLESPREESKNRNGLAKDMKQIEINKSSSGQKFRTASKFKEFGFFKKLTIDTEQDDNLAPFSTIISPKKGISNNFALCSKPKFLYYISKYSLKLGKNHEEALLSIRDYKHLLLLSRNSQKSQKMLKKAEEIEKRLESFYT